ncbi:hypothetical protein I4U23_016711 [Adineta vaga]|nr:hypothetical protein I4U23_016711 [Adineta vaga]
MYVYQMAILLLSLMFNMVLTNDLRGFNDDFCDPHTVTSEHYPSLLKSLTIQKTSPLKLKATYRLPNSTKEFSFEGMVMTGKFDIAAETAACRSLGCSKRIGATSMNWSPKPTCEFTCPDGTSAMQTCRYMIKELNCPADAMSLLECLTNEKFWSYGTNSPPGYLGIDLKCTDCEE